MTYQLESSKNIPYRDNIISRIAELRKVHTPEGIEVLEPVDIGGTQQWISIRGLNRENPVLLFIHGGPASPTLPLAWSFQKPWEDFFTVVQWDQRGSGKNASTFDMDEMAETLTMDQFSQDAEEMVEYICKRLDKEKIFVIGYSWGTVLGTLLAKNVPERLYAYMGLGQVGVDNEERIFEQLLSRANLAKNEEALTELHSIMPYPQPDHEIPLEKIIIVRKWARFFNGGWYGKPDTDLYLSLQDWAPEYSLADTAGFVDRMGALQEIMIPFLGTLDLEKFGFEFSIPVFFFMGRYDLHTAYTSARDYFDRIQAPVKKFFTFERSGHFIMFEEPGRLLMTMVNEVLPIAGKTVYFTRLPDAPL